VKKIKVPETIKATGIIIDERGTTIEIKLSFCEWLVEVCNQYKPFGKGPKGAAQFAKIYLLLDESKEKDVIEFEDADYAAVLDAANGPSFNPQYNRQIVPYYDAIKNVLKGED
jgi:hypothetical protein